MSGGFNLQQTEDPVLKGILDGARAFSGPEIVQFDITNRCNNNCLCCWNNSPLLGELSEEKKKERKYELPFDLVQRTISELKDLGTEKIFLAGGGEPFIHPQIMEILRCAKENKMKIFINTNFTLIDKERAKEIVGLKIDLIHVSLLAGTPEIYTLVHPNKTEATFNKIKKILKYLTRLRQQKRQGGPIPLPHLDLYYVIFNTNYRDIKKMADLAMEVRANSLEFTPMDVIPGKTDILLLNDSQRKEVLELVKIQHRRIEEFNKRKGGLVTFIEQYDSFINRLSSEGAAKGEYEANTVPSRPCYVGWAFARILANGNVTPCLKAHRVSIGNLYERPFREIWNSPEQQLFRKKSFKLDRTDPYFNLIGNNPNTQFGCLNSCDNIQINIDMHKKYADILRKYGRIR